MIVSVSNNHYTTRPQFQTFSSGIYHSNSMIYLE